MKQKPILKISKNILLEESRRQKAKKKRFRANIFRPKIRFYPNKR